MIIIVNLLFNNYLPAAEGNIIGISKNVETAYVQKEERCLWQSELFFTCQVWAKRGYRVMLSWRSNLSHWLSGKADVYINYSRHFL